jgi:hypothetical protein
MVTLFLAGGKSILPSKLIPFSEPSATVGRVVVAVKGATAGPSADGEVSSSRASAHPLRPDFRLGDQRVG